MKVQVSLPEIGRGHSAAARTREWLRVGKRLNTIYLPFTNGYEGDRKELGKRKIVLLYPHPKASLKPSFGSRLSDEVGTGMPHPTPLAISRNCRAVPLVLGTN